MRRLFGEKNMSTQVPLFLAQCAVSTHRDHEDSLKWNVERPAREEAKNALTRQIETTDTLFVVDSGDNIDKWIHLLNTAEVPGSDYLEGHNLLHSIVKHVAASASNTDGLFTYMVEKLDKNAIKLFLKDDQPYVKMKYDRIPLLEGEVANWFTTDNSATTTLGDRFIRVLYYLRATFKHNKSVDANVAAVLPRVTNRDLGEKLVRLLEFSRDGRHQRDPALTVVASIASYRSGAGGGQPAPQQQPGVGNQHDQSGHHGQPGPGGQQHAPHQQSSGDGAGQHAPHQQSSGDGAGQHAPQQQSFGGGAGQPAVSAPQQEEEEKKKKKKRGCC